MNLKTHQICRFLRDYNITIFTMYVLVFQYIIKFYFKYSNVKIAFQFEKRSGLITAPVSLLKTKLIST